MVVFFSQPETTVLHLVVLNTVCTAVTTFTQQAESTDLCICIKTEMRTFNSSVVDFLSVIIQPARD